MSVFLNDFKERYKTRLLREFSQIKDVEFFIDLMKVSQRIILYIDTPENFLDSHAQQQIGRLLKETVSFESFTIECRFIKGSCVPRKILEEIF